MKITVQRKRRATRRDAEPYLGTYLRDIRAENTAAARTRRLAALDRDIARLERWHHEWRLVHDAGYRELYAEEVQERRQRSSKSLALETYGTTPEERQAATRRIATWGRGEIR